MADMDPAKDVLKEKASSSKAKKSSETTEKVKKSSETTEKPGTSKGSSKSSKPNCDDEVMQILLAVRAEQLAATQKLDSFEKRLTGLESYGNEQYEY